MNLNRLLPVAVPFFIFVSSQIFLLWPKMIYLLSGLAGLFIFFTAWQFSRQKSLPWVDFFILPFVFFIGATAHSTMLASRLLAESVFFFEAVFIYMYFRQLYYFFFRSEAFKKDFFYNLPIYGNFLAFFFMAAALYGLASFLNSPVWILVALLSLASWALVRQSLFFSGLGLSTYALYLPVICLVLAQISWVIFFLPISYNASGLSLAVIYYVIIRLAILNLGGELNRLMAGRYLLGGSIAIALILLTTRWI